MRPLPDGRGSEKTGRYVLSETALMPWVPLIEFDRCPVGKGVFVEQGDKELAVFRTEASGEVFVIDNTCPHAGGNLSGGVVLEGCVTCPLHDWTFDLRTGVCIDSAKARVSRYATEVRDGVVFIEF